MQEKNAGIWRMEFWLVVIMLFVLTILVILVLYAPLEIRGGDNTTTLKDLLEYRKNILAVIITAFGAWVGAGAAYFFGRENLRESMSAIREMLPKERLRRITIREIPPKPIDLIVKISDEVGTVMDKLKEDPDRWFITIVKNDGSLENVVHEEAFWRYEDEEDRKGTPYAEVMKKKVSDVLEYLKITPKLMRVEKIYVPVSMDRSAGDAYELMQSFGLMQKKEIYLAIVVDDKGRPTHYMTTGDIRRVLTG